MNNVHQKYSQGGDFVISPISELDIFTREDFSEEHKEIYNMVMDFDKDKVLTQKKEIESYNPKLSKKLLDEMAELGLLGIDIPEEFGGIDLDKITSAIVAEALVYSPSFAVTWAVQTGIGSLPLIWFGTQSQKEKFLPKIASGEIICAYGLSEPSSGSDAMGAKTTASLSEDGKSYILNGEKVFITNGGWASLFTVFAQLDGKLTGFLVESGTEGFSIGAEEKKLGMKGSSTVALNFQNAKIPAENILSTPGKGSEIAFSSLDMGRFKLGCSCLGGSKMVINRVAEYAQERKAFGTSISNFDAIIKKVADMTVHTFTSDSMIYRTIGSIQAEIDSIEKSDENYFKKMIGAMEKFAIETSMVKVYASDTSQWVIDEGLQIFGGYGFLEEYPLAPAFRDNRINQIWEGTNEINRTVIIGFFMKKALTEEMPIYDAIQDIENFLNSNDLNSKDELLDKECFSLEMTKKGFLYLFNEALSVFQQDLQHEQQITELLADIMTNIYNVESTIIRAKKMYAKSQNKQAINIAKILTSEMVDHLTLSSKNICNYLKDHEMKDDSEKLLNEIISKAQLNTNTIDLKRNIAKHIFKEGKYPF